MRNPTLLNPFGRCANYGCMVLPATPDWDTGSWGTDVLESIQANTGWGTPQTEPHLLVHDWDDAHPRFSSSQFSIVDGDGGAAQVHPVCALVIE